MARGLSAGDVIKVGKTVELEALDTPGHTMCHVCLRSHTDQPALFSRRHAVQRRRRQLPQRRPPGGALQDVRPATRQACRNDTLIYPGHDYIENNLRFTLSREPDNRRAQEMLDKLKGQDPQPRLRLHARRSKREINTFFRLTSPT